MYWLCGKDLCLLHGRTAPGVGEGRGGSDNVVWCSVTFFINLWKQHLFPIMMGRFFFIRYWLVNDSKVICLTKQVLLFGAQRCSLEPTSRQCLAKNAAITVLRAAAGNVPECSNADSLCPWDFLRMCWYQKAAIVKQEWPQAADFGAYGISQLVPCRSGGGRLYLLCRSNSFLEIWTPFGRRVVLWPWGSYLPFVSSCSTIWRMRFCRFLKEPHKLAEPFWWHTIMGPAKQMPSSVFI